jgi:RNA polymerase subunit RPABC4/transcription elongation factor Spt4
MAEIECPMCGYLTDQDDEYCPECGEIMRKEKEIESL